MPVTFGDRDHTKDYFYLEGQKDLRAELAAQKEERIQKIRANAEASKAEFLEANAELLATRQAIEAEKDAVIENFLNLGLTPEVIANAMSIAVEKVLAIQEKTKK